MSDNKNWLYRLLKALDNLFVLILIKTASAFILLNSNMREKLKIDDRPILIMEGIFNSTRLKINPINDNCGSRIIMYSGNLNLSDGVMDLLEAFKSIADDKYLLWITGKGNSLDMILKASQSDPRIKYWPALGNQELFSLLQRATLLVNPLKSENPKTQFFFPSKTIEYMASGVPVLMHSLPCLPKEYTPYLFFFNDMTIIGMKNRIQEICEMSFEFRLDFGKRAQDFIFKYKSPDFQCKIILDMLNCLFN
jgi:glycosyltransferase involved in cell wall biosynthesis